MDIIAVAYKWAGNLTYVNIPKEIILHHAAASNCDVQTIDKWHKARGWSGIGYHYFVRKDGRIFKGRPDNAIGAQCLNHNTNTLGVCAEGNYETEQMPAAQQNSLKELVSYLKSKYGITSVKRHKDYNPTACPGKNYPFDYIKGGNTIMALVRGDKGAEVSALQTKLNKLGYKLVVDGSFGPATEAAVRDFQSKHGLEVDGKAGPLTMAALDKAIAPVVIDYKAKYDSLMADYNKIAAENLSIKNKLSQIKNIIG